jgi:hypothetical protein
MQNKKKQGIKKQKKQYFLGGQKKTMPLPDPLCPA